MEQLRRQNFEAESINRIVSEEKHPFIPRKVKQADRNDE